MSCSIVRGVFRLGWPWEPTRGALHVSSGVSCLSQLYGTNQQRDKGLLTLSVASCNLRSELAMVELLAVYREDAAKVRRMLYNLRPSWTS